LAKGEESGKGEMLIQKFNYGHEGKLVLTERSAGKVSEVGSGSPPGKEKKKGCYEGEPE